MKAEHRKELQTNALADRMGRMVQRIKTRPNRRGVLWIFGIVVLVIVLVGFFVWRNNRRSTLSQIWTDLGEDRITALTRDGKVVLSPWVGEYRGSNPGLAARYQIAWTILWEQGLKRLAASPTNAMTSINSAAKTFAELEEEAKDDPILAPEASYALAVIEEARALDDRDNLDKAIKRYKDVENKYKASAAGKDAGRRAKYLEENRIQVGEFYATLQQHLGFFRSLEKMEPPAPAPKKDNK